MEMTTVSTKLITGTPAVLCVPHFNQVVWDFATYNGTATNIYQIFQCPEDYVVLSAGYEILTAGTATGTLDLGKAGGTELLSGIALDAAAGTKNQGAMAAPVFFSDSDTIDVQINTATMIVGKIRLWWIGCDVSESSTVHSLP